MYRSLFSLINERSMVLRASTQTSPRSDGRGLAHEKLYFPLASGGFVRLSDYARERLGVAPRSLEDDAHVMRVLDGTPSLRAAFESGAVNWTEVRLLVRIATAQNEKRLLEQTLSLPTHELEAFVRTFARGEAADEDDTVVAAADAENEAGVTSTEPEVEDPDVRWSMPVSHSGRRMWRAACEFASRSAGAQRDLAGSARWRPRSALAVAPRYGGRRASEPRMVVS